MRMKTAVLKKKGRGLFAALALLTTFMVFLAACGSSAPAGSGGPAGSNPPAQPFTLDVAALGERLHTELEYRDQLEELEPEIVYTMLGIDAADVASQKNYISSGATAEEIIIFQAVDREAAVRLKEALAARCQDQQDVYASYAPEEVGYLQQAVLMDKETYVVFCVPVDGQAAEKLIKEALELK
ncbi:MAG: DUF4358 domain-containing protein [Clostridiales bacterium]